MKKKWIILIAAKLVLLALVAALGWWYYANYVRKAEAIPFERQLATVVVENRAV